MLLLGKSKITRWLIGQFMGTGYVDCTHCTSLVYPSVQSNACHCWYIKDARKHDLFVLHLLWKKVFDISVSFFSAAIGCALFINISEVYPIHQIARTPTCVGLFTMTLRTYCCSFTHAMCIVVYDLRKCFFLKKKCRVWVVPLCLDICLSGIDSFKSHTKLSLCAYTTSIVHVFCSRQGESSNQGEQYQH